MIIVVNAENRRPLEAHLVQTHRQRKGLFVNEAALRIPVIRDIEMDAHDRDDTIYPLAKEHPAGRYWPQSAF